MVVGASEEGNGLLAVECDVAKVDLQNVALRDVLIEVLLVFGFVTPTLPLLLPLLLLPLQSVLLVLPLHLLLGGCPRPF